MAIYGWALVRDLNVPGTVEPGRFWSTSSIEGNVSSILLQLRDSQKITAAEINRILVDNDPSWRVWGIYDLEGNLGKQLSSYRVAGSVSLLLALLAFGLAAVGIYGVLSYSMRMRQFELGVRMAIGANPKKIISQITLDALKPARAGIFVAVMLLIIIYIWVKQTAYHVDTSILGWGVPIALVLLLITATSLLSVWRIVSKRPIESLKG